MRWMLITERVLAVVATATIGLYGVSWIHRNVWSHAAVQGFENAQASASNAPELIAAPPKFDLWSEKRVTEYQESLITYVAPAIGILRIPKARIEAPILEGTDDLALNRGVGRIAGTARIGENGNIGIAGHRDGFFRGLKDVHTGDLIEMITSAGEESYIIDSIRIVKPDDVSVLAPRARPSLTLVTCYPFYFIGSAPERYIVQASVEVAPPLQKPTPPQSGNNAMAANGDGGR
jgi:sortase A